MSLINCFQAYVNYYFLSFLFASVCSVSSMLTGESLVFLTLFWHAQPVARDQFRVATSASVDLH